MKNSIGVLSQYQYLRLDFKHNAVNKMLCFSILFLNLVTQIAIVYVYSIIYFDLVPRHWRSMLIEFEISLSLKQRKLSVLFHHKLAQS